MSSIASLAFLTLGASLLGTPLKQDKQKIGQALSKRFERTGAQIPQVDLALELASQKLAEEALNMGLEHTSALHNVLRATSQAGAWDAMPRAYFFLGGSVDQMLHAAQQRMGNLNVQQATTHMGVGLASKGTQHALCILLIERKGLLSFPKMNWAQPLSRKKKIPVCVELYGRRTKPRLVVQTPQNQIQESNMQPKHNKWCAELSFPDVGRYTIEVISQTDRGPQVTHLFLMHMGKELHPPSASEKNLSQNPPPSKAFRSEPRGFEEKRQQIYDVINQLRQKSALQKLHVKKELEKLAQQYAQQMKEEAFFSHVDPHGFGLRERLKKAKIACQTASENLGSGNNPLDAHHAIEQSPAHRAALLTKEFQYMGIGFISISDEKTYLVEVFCN